jgi:fatty acid desaturase
MPRDANGYPISQPARDAITAIDEELAQQKPIRHRRRQPAKSWHQLTARAVLFALIVCTGVALVLGAGAGLVWAATYAPAAGFAIGGILFTVFAIIVVRGLHTNKEK